MQNKKKEKEVRENLAKHELEEIQKKRTSLYNQTKNSEYSTSSLTRKKKEIILDQVEEKKPAAIKDKGKRRMYEQETLSNEKKISLRTIISSKRESHTQELKKPSQYETYLIMYQDLRFSL